MPSRNARFTKLMKSSMKSGIGVHGKSETDVDFGWAAGNIAIIISFIMLTVVLINNLETNPIFQGLLLVALAILLIGLLGSFFKKGIR